MRGSAITRVYADLDEILGGMDAYVGRGSVTSADAARAGEGTTTTKFGVVDRLLDLPHGGRTRIRASVNAGGAAGRFEGGTDPVAVRLAGLGALARAGYPVGLTIAPTPTSPSSASRTASRRAARRCWSPGTRAPSWKWTLHAVVASSASSVR